MKIIKNQQAGLKTIMAVVGLAWSILMGLAVAAWIGVFEFQLIQQPPAQITNITFPSQNTIQITIQNNKENPIILLGVYVNLHLTNNTNPKLPLLIPPQQNKTVTLNYTWTKNTFYQIDIIVTQGFLAEKIQISEQAISPP